MSAKSVHAFEAYRRNAAGSTMPSPPADDPIAALEAEQRRYLLKASRAFERAQDLQAQIDLLKGKRL